MGFICLFFKYINIFLQIPHLSTISIFFYHNCFHMHKHIANQILFSKRNFLKKILFNCTRLILINSACVKIDFNATKEFCSKKEISNQISRLNLYFF